MARKSPITAEAVAAAIEKIQERGDRVTLAAIRVELGGGSFSTISPLYQAWEQAQVESSQLAEVEVPDRLAVAGEEWVARIWKIAVDAASAGHEALRRELVEATETIDAVRAESAELIAIVEGERDEAQEQIEAEIQKATALSDEIDEGRRAVAKIEAENARLLERIDARTTEATAARQTADVAAAREADMRKERDGVRAELVNVREELAHARDQLDAKSEKLESVQNDLGSARADLAKERAEHAATREKLTERMERIGKDLEAAQATSEASRKSEEAAVADALVTRKERDQAIAAQTELAAKVLDLEVRVDAAEKTTVETGN